MEPQTTHLPVTAVQAQPGAGGLDGVLNSIARWIAIPEVLIRAVLLLTFAAYFRTIAFDFVWDDNDQISMNTWLDSWSRLPRLLTQQVWAFSDFHTLANYYRPIFMLWLFLIKHLTGGVPAWYHLATIALHLGVVFEVYVLTRMLTRDANIAALAALIFGLHPTKVEAVAWISGGAEPLYAIFMFASVISWLHWQEGGSHRRKWLLAAIVSFALSLLTKETAVLTPALLAIYAWRAQDGAVSQRLRRAISGTWAFVVLIAVYLIWRRHVLHGLAQTSLTATADLKTALFKAPQVFWWYVWHLVWPVKLSVYYDPVGAGRFSFNAFVVPAIAAIILGVILWRAVRRSPAAVMLFWWFPLTLAPVIVSVALVQTHDRYLYVPSFPFAVGVAWLLLRKRPANVHTAQTAFAALMAVIAILLIAGTLQESRPWDNDIALFQRATQKAPLSRLPRLALAGAFVDRSRDEEARKTLQETLSRFPDELRAWELLGTLEYHRGHLDAAQAAYTQALATPYDESSKDFCIYSLGLIAQARGDLPTAEQWYRRAISASPGSAGPRQALALVLTLESRSKMPRSAAPAGSHSSL